MAALVTSLALIVMIGRLFIVALVASNVASNTHPSYTSSISCSVDVSLPGCRAVTRGGPIPVYVYPTLWEYDIQRSNPYVLHITNWLSKMADREGASAKQVSDPSAACLFLVTAPAAVLCNTSRIDCGFYEYWQAYSFETLSHWGKGAQGGMNHFLYMPWHTDWELPSYPTGRALLVRSASTNRTFWRGVDVQVPFYTPTCDTSDALFMQTCLTDQQVAGRGAAFLPDWVADIAAAEAAFVAENGAGRNGDASIGTSRVLLAGFVGAIRIAAPYVVPAPDLTVGNRLRVSLACLHLNPPPNAAPHGAVVVADAKDEFDFLTDTAAIGRDASINYLEPDHEAGSNGHVWGDYYWRVLLQSKYAFCPGGAGAHSQRLNEAIAAGAVPVVFDDDVSVLPLESYADANALWQKCAIHVHDVDHVATLAARLEQHFAGEAPAGGDDVEAGKGVMGWWWQQRQAACTELHRRFFASHDTVIDSAFRQIAQSLRTPQAKDSECCDWQRPVTTELEGYNGALPGEETPFAARERVVELWHARTLHPPAFPRKSHAWIFEGVVDVQVPLVGSYQEGLMCLHRQLTVPRRSQVQVREQSFSESGHSDYAEKNGDPSGDARLAAEVRRQQRLMAVASALGKESVVLQQFFRAVGDFRSCRLALENVLNISRSHMEHIEEWVLKLAAWCDYALGLLAERRAEEADAQSSHEVAIEDRTRAVDYFARALELCPETAREWNALRDEPIVNVVQSSKHTTEEARNGNSKQVSTRREIAALTTTTEAVRTEPPDTVRPVVCAAVDPISWLAWEFPMGISRECSRSACRVNVDQGYEATPIKSNEPLVSGSSCNATVYLTSFGGRPNAVNLPKMPRRNHVNAVIFMENDMRIIQGGRQGLALAMERTFGPDLSLAMGYRPTPPWEVSESTTAEESTIQRVPWRRVSYLNDPLERFGEWPSYFGHASFAPGSKHKHSGLFQLETGMLPGIAFFSSQCDSVLAKSRLDILAALVPALQAEGVWFASFGKCFHNEDFTDVLPECAELPRHTVDHDEAKSCALSRFAFTLAIENSEDDGYATEKLWQPLLAGSVPVYWGAPDVKTMLPDPSAAVHVRDFNGNMAKLAAYLKRLLDSPDVFELHRAWKRQSPDKWSSDFKNLAAIPKDSTFCSVCDYAAEHATVEHVETSVDSGTRANGNNEGDSSSSNHGGKVVGHIAASGQTLLGFFDLGVEIDGKAVQYRVDIPQISNDVALQRYVNRICSEVQADLSGCEAVEAEIVRLQIELTKSLVQ